jgi:hypothetical protein
VITVNFDCSKTDITKFVNNYPNQDNQIDILHCSFAMADRCQFRSKSRRTKKTPHSKSAQRRCQSFSASSLIRVKINSIPPLSQHFPGGEAETPARADQTRTA